MDRREVLARLEEHACRVGQCESHRDPTEPLGGDEVLV
jgi:hypothetical protein